MVVLVCVFVMKSRQLQLGHLWCLGYLVLPLLNVFGSLFGGIPTCQVVDLLNDTWFSVLGPFVLSAVVDWWAGIGGIGSGGQMLRSFYL